MQTRSFLRSLENANPQYLICGLWATIAFLGIGLSFVPPIESSVPLKLAGTTGCGIGLSFFVTKLTQRTLALPQRESLALLALTIFASGTLLWLVDTLLQASTVAGGWTLQSFAIRRYNWVYFNMLFGFQIIVLALIQSTRSLAQREKELVEAQLTALRFQVNPHFLFNTLNAISTLISERNGDAAEEMIAKLADFFSATLHADLSALVPLGRELETIQAYLDIETVRFGERLHVEYRFDEMSVVASVPSLILQPLVENAIKYAVAPTVAGATIIITALVVEQELIITVEDYATTASPRDHTHSGAGAGLGLRNVAQRLQTQYGQAGSLETKKVDDGFLATIRLPISQSKHWRKA